MPEKNLSFLQGIAKSNAPDVTTVALTIEDIQRAVLHRLRFIAGRNKINAARHAALVLSTDRIRKAYDLDLLNKQPKRGRVMRIARKLRMKHQTVSRILREIGAR